MTTPHRLLASSEAGFVGPHPTTCAFEVIVRGPLDTAVLADAFAALRAAHPALDAAVAVQDATDGDSGSAGFAFVPSGPGAPITVGAGEELVDPAVALGRLHIASDGDRHTVTFAAAHALADGTHLFALLRELWTRYTALVRGQRVAVVPQPFPQSAQHFLADLEVPLVDTGRRRLDGARWYGRTPTGTVTGPVLPETFSLRFSAAETARFADAASGIGFTALLSGVLLTAERAGFLEEDPAAPIRIGAMTLVDLRRRVRPALGATEVTNFVGASFTAADVDAASDPAAIGAAVAESVRADVLSGRSLAVLAQAPSIPAEPPVVLSNLGVLALDLPDGLIAEDLRPIVSMDSAALHAAGGPRRPSPSATIHQISTFQGRLGIDAITLGGTASAASRTAVADRIRALVHSAARLTAAA